MRLCKSRRYLKADFTPFFYRWKTDRRKNLLLTALKFKLFHDTLILRFVDCFHSASDSKTHKKIKFERKPKKQKGKRREKKRSDNKGRWDRIHFSISCSILPYSLETRDCKRMNGNLFAQKFSIILISSPQSTQVEEIFCKDFFFSSFVQEKMKISHSILILFFFARASFGSVNSLPWRKKKEP